MGPSNLKFTQDTNIASHRSFSLFSHFAVSVPAVPRVASGGHRAASQLRRRPHHLEMDFDRSVRYVDIHCIPNAKLRLLREGRILQFYCTNSFTSEAVRDSAILIPVVYRHCITMYDQPRWSVTGRRSGGGLRDARSVDVRCTAKGRKAKKMPPGGNSIK